MKEPHGGNPRGDMTANRAWLREQMSSYFFVAMKDEPEALEILARELGTLRNNRRLLLADRDNAFIVAMKNRPGTLYETLRRIAERDISYAMFAHSAAPLPGLEATLEIQRFAFDRKGSAEISAGRVTTSSGVRRRVRAELRVHYPEFDFRDFDRLLRILWLNNENYVRISPALHVARTLNLLQQGNRSGGLYLDVETMGDGGEFRVLFAVANPPPREFLLQVMEVFNHLNLGVNRAYCLTINNGVHPYFLGIFLARPRDGALLCRDSDTFTRLRQELYTTQILATRTSIYREWVATGITTGEDASLITAFRAFCHANLSHNQPDRFGIDDVHGAFHANPEIALRLIRLFRVRFDPALTDRDRRYAEESRAVRQAITDYNTGHRYLDELRRTVFLCCLAFIRHTLKTNFFVPAKQALAFRLDPAYLDDLGAAARADLPPAVPYRITFFFSRSGYGFHIGFSDIARGGWRTVIARSSDDFITNATTLFREGFVLAHTQHLKNKDIYEGGSKMVTLLDSSDLGHGEGESADWNLYKFQYGIINAFLDIMVTDGGRARNPAVVDYYGEDEPIELGPDENLHDIMIETIADLSRHRGYLLGAGLISSKRVGINHKEYGVTSTGVMKFVEITMAELGLNIRTDPFSVKFTGGPNGDVAGNALDILLKRSPLARIVLILDGTAALRDPEGVDHAELQRLLLRDDLDRYPPEALHPDGFMIFRSGSRKEGQRELYRKVSRSADGLIEEWLTIDEFSREYATLPFTVPADLFIPAGGRPETIDAATWERFLLPDGTPSARVIVEGANSFITPEARINLQQRGALIMRDASANKCGVISSSFEIIANLLLSEEEFLAEKERYVRDVLEILEKVSEAEARLILERRRANPALPCTDISDAISREINANYARLFKFFQTRPELCLQAPFRRAILAHLPRMLREESKYSRRLGRLPRKYLSAILAAEIGSSMVYCGNLESGVEDEIRMHLARQFSDRQGGYL